ncbi:TetR/AcrR family transcriptional regulator [Aliidiomarina quisquiliarum]|uniref:TetR/AcrR family transcriptional regulator n=1 Tax=Aliidiomarina quisquiliarum TaxID=2938947 RepID=UPI00208F0736|nr:TetR/AcrR family transcriptional regulator [Aliidiomarina quisquiliarum]MCO4321366.1 TetR/AcrR family transcriptional regulator [Aliidiomarina quisquiliarum]
MPKKAHPLLDTDYPQVVLNEQTESPARKKGERTKQSLIWACAQLLNQIGYQELRVSDICEVAQVSNAAFYLYFKNKVDITQVTLEGFSIQIFDALLSNTEQGSDNKTALYNSNLAWLQIAGLNAGLMRCILQVSFVIPEFAKFYDNLNSDYILKVAKNIAKRAAITEAEAQMLVFALSSMTDEFTRRLLSEVDSPLDTIVKKSHSSETELAEFLSNLWYKAIYT